MVGEAAGRAIASFRLEWLPSWEHLSQLSTVTVTCTGLRGWRHSRQRSSNRDVISPQDGHIICDPYKAVFRTLRVLRNTQIVNSAMSRPTEKLIPLMSALFQQNEVPIRFGTADSDNLDLDRPARSLVRKRMGSCLNPHFYRLRKRDRRRGLRTAAQKGDGKRCERDYLTLFLRHRNSNHI
jgi:hypothetical protein